MLVLARKKGESIMIHDEIEVIVLGVEGDVVKLGIAAPKSVSVYRKEVYYSIQKSNEEAVASTIRPQDLLKWARNKDIHRK